MRHDPVCGKNGLNWRSILGLRAVLFDATLQFVDILSDRSMRMRVLWILLACCVASTSARADRVDDLLDTLRSPSFKVRVQTVLVLGTQTQQKNRVVQPLIRSLKDRHRAVRAASAIALGRLGDVSSLPGLSEALEDDDRNVVQSATKAMKRVVDAFVKSRGPFRDSRYNITIAGLRDSTGNGYTGTLKDAVLESLLNLELENLTVGADASFESGDNKAAKSLVELDLSGQIVTMSEKKCTLKVVLALRSGGFVVHTWKGIQGRGKTMDEALQAAVSKATKQLMRFLGHK